MNLDVKKGLARQFSFIFKNTMDEDVTVAIFKGLYSGNKYLASLEGFGGEKGSAGVIHSHPEEIRLAGFVDVDCLAHDGVILSDKIDKNKALICKASSRSKSIASLHSWLDSGESMLISRIQVKAATREQLDNPLILATSSPFVNNGDQPINFNSYASAQDYKDNIVNVDVLSRDMVIRHDSVAYLKINSGETVTITFELADDYNSVA